MKQKLFIKKNLLLIIFSFLFFTNLYSQSSLQVEVNNHLKNLPFNSFQIHLPSFQNKTFNIKDYGASW